ncbi:MAG: hypothetical protein G8237_01435 [Magnetococcales bacterium]|nr:hypothetical protein [Magnetococcales bacterium]NGZ04999.1 hypothetical protein [Magnetococcales bacterium]
MNPHESIRKGSGLPEQDAGEMMDFILKYENLSGLSVRINRPGFSAESSKQLTGAIATFRGSGQGGGTARLLADRHGEYKYNL